ncbi:MAG: alpha-amylase domain-containing protein, partial [Bacteroidota bacterium]
TNTNIGYVTHTGAGEANYTWNYADFHPVDGADFLTNWDWNGGNSAIIPNTKGFGNDFNTYSSTVQTRLNNWGYWMANNIGFDGFRLDFVRGFQIDFVRSWIANLPLLNGSQRFIVGEYWGPDFRIKEWVNGLAAGGVDADGFDFPLKTSLTDMCNGNGGGFDMRWLNHAGMVRNNNGNALSGTSIVTWLENHDTGKEHDKWVTKDWKMGYAYVLTHEGRPCIFYPHYYGVTLVDNHDATKTVAIPSTLKDDINKLLFVRKTYLGGTLQVLSEVGNPWPAGDAYNVYVARRQGNGTKSGAIVVINNHDSNTKGLWVDSSPSGYTNWAGVTLVNAFNSSETTVVQADGRVWVSAPARGYAVWVRQNEYVGYVAPLSSSLMKQSSATSREFAENVEEGSLKVFPNPGNQTITIAAQDEGTAPTAIAIYNDLGELVLTKKLSGKDRAYEWATGQLDDGLYVIKLQTAEGVKTTRVQIRH